MFKNMRFDIFFDPFLNPSFKVMISFSNVARTTVSTSISIYQDRFQIIRNWDFIYKTILILNELKTSLMVKFSLQSFLQSFKSLFSKRCEGLLIYDHLN